MYIQTIVKKITAIKVPFDIAFFQFLCWMSLAILIVKKDQIGSEIKKTISSFSIVKLSKNRFNLLNDYRIVQKESISSERNTG